MYKSKLQELCHQRTWELPVYSTVMDGPDHCPRFTTTVTVNGVRFESPQNQCKSSKEAQNVAAELAYDHFSASSNVVASPPSPPSLPRPFPGFDIRPVNNVNVLQKLGGNVQNSQAAEAPPVQRDENKTKDLLHVYKNRLQHYVQKNNLALPEYSYESDGPPHARLFRASVVVDGVAYRSPEYYRTLKDAEHAAAKEAMESLSLGEIQEEEGLCKTLLQEFAQKEGFHSPSYSTEKTGPSHMPTFVSTVEVGDQTYQGRECKTKKQSEMSAAMVAYNILMERRTVNNLNPACNTKENTRAVSLSLQPVIDDECLANMGVETTGEYPVDVVIDGTGEMDGNSSELSHGGDRKEPLEVSSSSFNSVVTSGLHQHIQPKPVPTVKDNLDAEIKGEETNTKRYKCSSPIENMYKSQPETSPLLTALPSTPSSCSMPSVSVESDAAMSGGDTPRVKILVFPRASTRAIPEGAAILPCSDDKWVAVRVELNQNQQLQ